MSNLPITNVFNDGYILEQYEAFRRDPNSVDESWRQFFRFAQTLSGSTGPLDASFAPGQTRIFVGARTLAAAIRRLGHLAVPLDPLGAPPPGSPQLTPEAHGVTEAELKQLPANVVLNHVQGTAADAIQLLRDRYCTTIGYELDHIGAEAERRWFRAAIESEEPLPSLNADEKKTILERLTQVDGLERYLAKAFVGVKRFSIEGVDALIPMLDDAIAGGAKGGAKQVMIGMNHRGRMNVLVHITGKTYRALFEAFAEHFPAPLAHDETGDVKYHLGGIREVEVPGVGTVQVEVAANPSHLEFVNSVAMGMARARQRGANGRNEASVLPIVVHGDASFPGEGIVTETMNLSMLRGFRVGGTIHIISNNQVGFTTDPVDSRSTRYSSDPAKGFDMPIAHVNADDPEACIQAIRLAIAYRAKFGRDFVIDLVGYRRFGHNEADQPAFTQPKMYETIASHPTAREIWGNRLVRERVVSEADVKALDDRQRDLLQKTFEEMKKEIGDKTHSEHAERQGPVAIPAVDTTVRAEKLVSLNEQLLTWPSTFKLHPTIQRTLPRRRDALQDAIDWGHAEALAFASLLTDGFAVRLTGQDVERGTFSHRQAVLHDASTNDTYTPLANLPNAKAPFEIYNSPLSETAVLGFEYGFSVAAPKDMVLWEAQFGDFVNVAQPVIDQFISAARAKWGQDSGLVMLLPHGYEGQGPEHSSARLERFLQLYAEGNIIVASPTTPAQYFHILRRQALRSERRPLVLMQPKSLLRLPAAASKLDDLTSKQFQAVLDDSTAVKQADQVTRLVFCAGKVYYDITAEERPASVAVIRVEELAPWPTELSKIIDQYPNVEEVVWAQEEPKNMGAWSYVQPRLRASIGTLPILRYIGRPERASPAEGHKHDHDVQQKAIVRDVLTVTPSRKKVAAK
ncbi:MAG TPA: 2-oxoglutarate dehydrogenase E1 component [Gemmatimonadaceae bacterium]